MRNDYLAHHGILGQKWGIRNYQNSDGSLTEEGRKRYGIGPGREVGDIKSKKGIERRLNDIDKAKARNARKMGKYISKTNSKATVGQRTKYANKIQQAQDYINKGNDEIKSLLERANDEGYEVNSSYTRRLTSSGAEIIGRTILGSTLATSMLLPFGKFAVVPNWSTTAGTKYKVKDKKA